MDRERIACKGDRKIAARDASRFPGECVVTEVKKPQGLRRRKFNEIKTKAGL